MNLSRRAVLAVADNAAVTRLFRSSSLTRSMVGRFVAGETLETALDATQDLAQRGITATLDLLGENVTTGEEANRASAEFVRVLRAMWAAGLEPNISVKLTQLGLDLGAGTAIDSLIPILAAARDVGGFVRLDMEGSAYVEETLSLFERVHDEFPTEVGVVIQTYLRRSADDIHRLIGRGARVRLVKGAYAEPEAIAYQRRFEVDENFARLARKLLSEGTYPAIATHDTELIRSTLEHARREALPSDRFEFQMLYGVRRDRQTELVNDGYRMRVYVPYGTEWYPYFSRRIAERPANALFVLRQLRG